MADRGDKESGLEPRHVKRAVLRGGVAKICSQGANVFLRIGALMVFARLLEPTDFGLVGMVTAVTGVLGLLKDFGMSTATVQRATVTDDQVSALFWLNLALGAILWLLCLAMAPVLAVFYHEPRLVLVTAALGAGFFLTAAGVQHNALLQRQMRFETLAVIEIAALVVSTSVGLGMALSGLGYWSLVAWSVALPAASSVGAWLAARWLPGRPRRVAGVRSMLHFGGLVTLNIFIMQVAFNLDKVLLGRYWGADVLGVYGRAYQLVSMASEILLSTIGSVAFPALSRIRDDPVLLQGYFLKGYKLVVALALPITGFCIVLAKDIVLVLLGERWESAVTTFTLLSPIILIFALIYPLGWLMYSVGLIRRSITIAAVILPVASVGYVVGLPFGANGVAAGGTAMMALWTIPHLVWCTRGTAISVRQLLRAVRPAFFAAVSSSVMAYAGLFVLNEGASHVLRILLGGSVFLATYVWVLLWMLGEKAFYFDLIRSLRRSAPA